MSRSLKVKFLVYVANEVASDFCVNFAAFKQVF